MNSINAIHCHFHHHRQHRDPSPGQLGSMYTTFAIAGFAARNFATLLIMAPRFALASINIFNHSSRLHHLMHFHHLSTSSPTQHSPSSLEPRSSSAHSSPTPLRASSSPPTAPPPMANPKLDCQPPPSPRAVQSA
jgi:hypothetical protein